jgi:hypothetical protein
MSWSIYKANILQKTASGELNTDDLTIATIVTNEYDNAVKRGGDMINGFPVANGNKTGMILGIKSALDKGRNSGENDFNLIEELGPAFTSYWLGATLAPYPNPLVKPLGYVQVLPPPGTVKAIGPDPIGMIRSATQVAVTTATLKTLIDNLKNKNENIPGLGLANVYDTAKGVIDKKITDPKIKEHPTIMPAILLILKSEEVLIPTPNITMNSGIPLKFPKPKGPSRSEKIKAARQALLDKKKQFMDKLVSDFNLKHQTPATVPTQAELDALARAQAQASANFEIEMNYIPNNIPKISFSPPGGIIKPNSKPGLPDLRFIDPSKLVWADPFINAANNHLSSVGGMIFVLAQYPPPAPPAPGFITWNGYTVRNEVPIPNIPIPVLY